MNFMRGIRLRLILSVMSLVVLLTITVTWVAVRVLQRNAFREAAAGLDRDARTFHTLHNHRSAELLTRARLLAGEPKIIAALGTSDIDRPTVQHLAEDVRADGDLDFLMMWSLGKWEPAVSVKGLDAPLFLIQGMPSAATLLSGKYLTIGDKDLHVVSAPVRIGDQVYGFVTIGDFVRETHFEALRPLIGSEIILCAQEGGRPSRVMAATLAPLSAIDAAAIHQAAAEHPGQARTPISHADAEYLLRAASLDSGVLAVFLKPLAQAQAVAASTRKWAAVVAAGFLLIAIPVVLKLAQSISGPISKLVEDTESISNGKFDTRADIQSPEELRRLSNAFNLMAVRIKSAIAQEQAARAGLEEQVKERTKDLAESNRMLVAAHQELKERTGRMIQYEKLVAIGTLAAGIAHELNNPLSVIMGNASFLYDSVTDPLIRKRCQNMVRQSERCGHIVKNMLKFARQEGPTCVPSNLNLLIDLALELAKMGSGFENINILRNYDNHLPLTLLDESLMEQVFLNIIANAFHAMRDAHGGGTFTVSTCVKEGRIHMQFSDDGPGIHPDVAAKIFDPFFTTKGVGEGTGLGLSVSHGIVQQHGGRIFVEQTGPAGTTFTVELPILTLSHKTAEAPGAEGGTPPPAIVQSGASGNGGHGKEGAPAAAKFEGVKVLLVDDEPDIREIMEGFLKAAGCAVIQAASSDEAIRIVETNGPIDVLFVDIRMPGMNGMELYHRFSAIHPDLAGRIVFVTGDTLSPDVHEFLEFSGCLSVIKPFHMKDLTSAVRCTINQPHGVRHS